MTKQTWTGTCWQKPPRWALGLHKGLSVQGTSETTTLRILLSTRNHMSSLSEPNRRHWCLKYSADKNRHNFRDTHPRTAAHTKSSTGSIIARASKGSPQCRRVVIRSLNLLYWLGNLSKKFLSWTALITHKMTGQTGWESSSHLEREMAGWRAARGSVQIRSMWMLNLPGPDSINKSTGIGEEHSQCLNEFMLGPFTARWNTLQMQKLRTLQCSIYSLTNARSNLNSAFLSSILSNMGWK